MEENTTQTSKTSRSVQILHTQTKIRVCPCGTAAGNMKNRSSVPLTWKIQKFHHYGEVVCTCTYLWTDPATSHPRLGALHERPKAN